MQRGDEALDDASSGFAWRKQGARGNTRRGDKGLGA
jgi:hypothetical protein